MYMQFAAQTDKGKRRALNEDLYYVDENSNLLVIADGMGGHNAGEVASQIAVTVFQEWATDAADLDLSPDEQLAVLKQLTAEANRRVYAYSQQHNLPDGMGTTLIAGFLTPTCLVHIHIGDSRIYVLRDDAIELITRDHSLVQKMVDSGLLTPQEARIHPKRNVISRAVGLESTVLIDEGNIPMSPDDIVLVCTDGLYDMVINDTEIAALVRSAADLKATSSALINKALDYGGEDNVTLILATYN
jgi:protein phosphatase